MLTPGQNQSMMMSEYRTMQLTCQKTKGSN